MSLFLHGSRLEKFCSTSLAHQWILCSEWVPSEWESKQLINTSHQSTSNPHHSSSSVILRSEKLNICKKQIHDFNFKQLLLTKSPLSITSITSFCSKIIDFEINFEVHDSCKQICRWIWCERTTGDGLFHWRKRHFGLWAYILARGNDLKLKCLNHGFVS